jgi:membrane-associated protease RseP (regulator of RpoE activity)
MNRTSTGLSLLALSLLPACAWPHVGEYIVGAQDQVLVSRNGPGGTKETYKLAMRDDAKLVAEREFDRERPSLGLQLAELDKTRAERRGVRPYSGLLVRSVTPRSAAAAAGMLAQDVLVSIDETETVYFETLRELEDRLRPGQVVNAKVLRGQQQLDVPLRVQLEQERITEQEEIDLVAPASSSRPFAGVTLRGVPPMWAERVFGSPREAVIVTNIEVGSPAWLAGVRPGDVVDKVDGAPVGDVHALTAQLAQRGEAGEPMTWSVHRGAGDSHDAAIALADYRGESNLWVPLVFRLTNDTYEDLWSIGPFGLVMSNRNQYVENTRTRRVQTRNEFSALLGLLQVDSRPEETEVRLLWIIRFDT